MFPNPPGLLRLEPYSAGVRETHLVAPARTPRRSGRRISSWACSLRRSRSTKRRSRPGAAGRAEPALEAASQAAGHARSPRCRCRAASSRSRTTATAVLRRARAAGPDRTLGGSERAIFGRCCPAEPDVLIDELEQDEAIAEADTLLSIVPNQLGVDANATSSRRSSSTSGPAGLAVTKMHPPAQTRMRRTASRT